MSKTDVRNSTKKIAAMLGALLLFLVLNNLAAEKTQSQLSLKLSQIKDEKPVTVIVRFRKQTAKSFRQRKLENPNLTQKQMFRQMRQESEIHFSALKTFLNSNNLIYRNFWLINAALITASPKIIQQIAQRDDVEEICENVTLSVPPVETAVAEETGSDSTWGIAKIGADKVWPVYGITGKGVKVGHLDTGVDTTHPDLAGKLSLWAEFDTNGSRIFNSTPHDSGSHGTHTAGTILGGENSGSAIGVAPSAELISALVLNENSGSLGQVIAGMEWVIDPDNNPNTDDGAQVVNMSLGSNGSEALLVEPTENMIAAGVFPCFSIGNSGLGTTSSPGNIPSAFGVGATDSNDSVAYFSSGGEATWNVAPYIGSYLKPDISAPGVNIKSSVPGGKYSFYSGTSMAAPHLAGVVALMLEANPHLTIEEIKTNLKNNSIDLGTAGQDNRYGWGRIDAFASLTQILSSGRLVGTVTNGTLVLPATVKIVEKNIELATVNGEYSFTLPAGIYTVQASAFGYATLRQEKVEVKDNQITTQNFILSPLPAGILQGTIKDSQSNAPLSAAVQVTNTAFVPVNSDPRTGFFSLSLPEGIYSIKINKIGYATQIKEVEMKVGKTAEQNFALSSLPPVLVVDDDGGASWSDCQSYYQSALDDLGLNYDYHNTAVSGSPAAEKLLQYPGLIWFTGNTWKETLTDSDQENLKIYLNNGGRLFLSGEDIGWDLKNSNFTQNYLHAIFKQDDTNLYTLSGQDVSILQDLSLNIKGGGGANNQKYPSEIDAVSPAKLILKYEQGSSTASVTTTPESSLVGPFKVSQVTTAGIVGSGGAGVSVETEKYKLVYLSFGFEGINNRQDRKTVLAKILNYLDLPLPLYLTFSGYQATEIKIVGSPDGVVSPGEEIALTVSLKNLSTSYVSGITAGLSVKDSFVSITNNRLLNFNDIAGGETARSLNQFDFALSPNCPDLHTIPFMVEIKDKNGYTWIENWGIKTIVLPEPVRNLTAVAQADGSINLEWSVSGGKAGKYNIYYDNGSGIIDYQQLLATVAVAEQSWNSPILANKTTYRFGVRAVSTSGYEEKNTSVTVTAQAEKLSSAEALLITPKAEMSVRGSAVSLIARGNETTVGVQFKYRGLNQSDWTNIAALDYQPINSSSGKLFSAYWNTLPLTAGEYDLAAAGVDGAGHFDLSPASVKVKVNGNNVVDIIEDGDQENDPNATHLRLEKVYANTDNEIWLADGTKISIKAGTIPHDTILQIKKLGAIEKQQVSPPAESNLKSVGIYYDFKFFDGTTVFSKTINLQIPYADTDADGIIDGTTIPEKELKLYYRNSLEWQEVSSINPSYSIIDLQKKYVYADINHFSVFSLMANVLAGNLDNVSVYPNPYKPALGHSYIYFDNLTEKVKIQIFTIAGRLVRELNEVTNSQRLNWDVRNDDGEDLASGVYFYLISDEHGNKAKGKIAVIR